MSPQQTTKLSDFDNSYMRRGGLLNKHICQKKSNCSNESAETVIFIFFY